MKRKVWIFNHYAISAYFNRGGRHYWFAKNLRANGFEPTVFSSNRSHKANHVIDTANDKFSEDVRDDIPFVFVRTTAASGNGMDRVKNMVMFYRNLFPATRAYVKKHGKPEVIIASSVHPLTMVAGIQIARKIGVPCICEIRDLWPEAIFAFNKAKAGTLLGKILLAGEHWIYRNADALIFTKEGDTDYIREKKWDVASGGDIDLKKAFYINNGVDIEDFNRSINENILADPDLTADRFNAVYVGAIRPVNNVGNIIDSARLLEDHPEIKFLIYGDGIQREELEKRVADLKLQNVKIKGHVEKKYIPYILSRSSVNILNYSQTQYNWTRGNSSNKLFEYMASGKPVISTVKMGYSILEKYQCGLELENASPRELAEAILKVKNMPKDEYQRLGAQGKKGAEDFDFKVLTGKLMDVIDWVLQKKRD